MHHAPGTTGTSRMGKREIERVEEGLRHVITGEKTSLRIANAYVRVGPKSCVASVDDVRA